MRSIKICSALLIMLTISVGCEKETFELPVEDAKASEYLTFSEFINSGIDVPNYMENLRVNESKFKSSNKSNSATVNADEAYFDKFCYNLPEEDFEEANIPDDNGSEFLAPLSEDISHTTRIKPVDIETGLLITTDATTTKKVLAIYGDGFSGSNTKVLSARTDQAIVLQFTDGNVLSVGLDISSFPYPEKINTQEVTIEVLYASGETFQEIITASIDGTFWGITGDEIIEQLKVSSTNLDAWVGVDNIAFGTCVVPDADVDGCPDIDDPSDTSNMETTVIIGSCNSGVANRMTSVCGISLSDDVDSFEEGIYTYRNHGALVKEFASLTNLWVSEGLISSEEKDLLMSCAAKAGF